MCKIKRLKRSHFCFDSRGLGKTNYLGKTYLVKEIEYIYGGNILLYFEHKLDNPPLMFNISSNNFTAIRKYIDYLTYCKRQNLDNIIQDEINKNKLKINYITRNMKLFHIHCNLYNNELVRLVFHYV